jgi:hypothetical protein
MPGPRAADDALQADPLTHADALLKALFPFAGSGPTPLRREHVRGD